MRHAPVMVQLMALTPLSLWVSENRYTHTQIICKGQIKIQKCDSINVRALNALAPPVRRSSWGVCSTGITLKQKHSIVRWLRPHQSIWNEPAAYRLCRSRCGHQNLYGSLAPRRSWRAWRSGTWNALRPRSTRTAAEEWTGKPHCVKQEVHTVLRLMWC